MKLTNPDDACVVTRSDVITSYRIGDILRIRRKTFWSNLDATIREIYTDQDSSYYPSPEFILDMSVPCDENDTMFSLKQRELWNMGLLQAHHMRTVSNSVDLPYLLECT